MEKTDKPIHYCVIICLEKIDDTLLDSQSDLLKISIPVTGPPKNPWKRSFIKSSFIFNIRTWNSIFTNFPITRISHYHT